MITVGTGDTVEHGITCSIDSGNPELVVLICTEASEARVNLSREAVPTPGPQQRIGHAVVQCLTSRELPQSVPPLAAAVRAPDARGGRVAAGAVSARLV